MRSRRRSSRSREEDRTPPITGNDASVEEAETGETDAPILTQADARPLPPEDEPTNQDILPDHIESFRRRR